MQTRCPTCETIYRLTDEQARAASGMVQCSLCKSFFNAMGNLLDESTGTVVTRPDETGARGGIITVLPKALSAELPAILAEGYVPMRPPAPWWSTMAWSLLILACLVAALGQMAWFNINRLADEELLAPYIERACERLPCMLDKPRDLGKIELLSRDVRTHPTREGALLITATFINRAEFEQPYPQVSLTLSDLSGQVIAYRHFQPHEYISGDRPADGLMPVGVPASMVMEVVDPGEETVSYRFDFL